MSVESAGNLPAQTDLPKLPTLAPAQPANPSTASANSGTTPVVRDHSGEHLHPPAERASKTRPDIPGWGADLDHANRPAYPKERMPPRLEHVHAGPLEDQPLNMTVFHSTERPGVTPIFGTSAPPSGLSGKLRGVAYGLSENDIRHWLLLLLADRINVVEGIGADLMEGRVPNLIEELGLASEWKYNRAGFIRKAAIASAVAGTAYLLLRRRRSE